MFKMYHSFDFCPKSTYLLRTEPNSSLWSQCRNRQYFCYFFAL